MAALSSTQAGGVSLAVGGATVLSSANAGAVTAALDRHARGGGVAPAAEGGQRDGRPPERERARGVREPGHCPLEPPLGQGAPRSVGRGDPRLRGRGQQHLVGAHDPVPRRHDRRLAHLGSAPDRQRLDAAEPGGRPADRGGDERSAQVVRFARAPRRPRARVVRPVPHPRGQVQAQDRARPEQPGRAAHRRPDRRERHAHDDRARHGASNPATAAGDLRKAGAAPKGIFNKARASRRSAAASTRSRPRARR